MISIIKEMIQDRRYVPGGSTVESNERMGPYVGEDNDLVVLMARDFVDKSLFGADTNILARKDISNLTLDYYKSVQEDIIEFATIIVIPSGILDISIFEDDISVYGMTMFIEEELMFNPTCNVLVPRHSLVLSSELQEMKEKCIYHNSLPKIYAKDPICKWYGFKRDNIIRIERDYCDEVYYRIVI